MSGVMWLVAVIYAAAQLVLGAAAVWCLLFGAEDPRFEGDKLIYRS